MYDKDIYPILWESSKMPEKPPITVSNAFKKRLKRRTITGIALLLWIFTVTALTKPPEVGDKDVVGWTNLIKDGCDEHCKPCRLVKFKTDDPDTLLEKKYCRVMYVWYEKETTYIANPYHNIQDQ